jgi:hypothetical protein
VESTLRLFKPREERHKSVITFGDLLVHFEQNSCEETNVFRVFDAGLIVIKVIHRFVTEWSDIFSSFGSYWVTTALCFRVASKSACSKPCPVGKLPIVKRLKGKRDRARLALLLACGLRRHEAVALTLELAPERKGPEWPALWTARLFSPTDVSSELCSVSTVSTIYL